MFTRRAIHWLTYLVLTGVVMGREAHAQAQSPALLQLEVGDSIGLPLPDATLEVFALHEGGIVWEWTRVDPATLPPGIHLLRFSHPGYRPAVFSIPVRKNAKVSLRVKLDPEGTAPPTVGEVRARPVHAIGLALDGKSTSDVMGQRRVIEPPDIAAVKADRFNLLFQRLRDPDVRLTSGRGGSFLAGPAGASTCVMPVMLNGDRRQVVAFSILDRMFRMDEVEAIEILPRSTAVPVEYRVRDGGCGVVSIWLKDP